MFNADEAMAAAVVYSKTAVKKITYVFHNKESKEKHYPTKPKCLPFVEKINCFKNSVSLLHIYSTILGISLSL